MQRKSEHWLTRLTACAYFDWPEWLGFWVSDVCCQMQKYWRAKKRLNVHVNKDSSSSLYAENILLFLKLEFIRSIFTSVKKKNERTIKGNARIFSFFVSLFFNVFTVMKLTFQSNFWFSLYPTKRHRNWLDTSASLFPITSTIFFGFAFLGSWSDILWSWAFPWSSFRRISLLSM